MAKNDVVVRTAADLERKYNFASLLGLKKNVELTAQGIQKIENELNSMLNALIINLKDVLDSQSEISLWFYSGKPTISNKPYTLWSNPSDHIGDIYYDQNSGAVYQWNKVWEVNTSPDLIEAMAITNAETDASTDHERKVFFNTPTIPYSNGDWWIKEDGSLFICQISKTSGAYETADFIDSSKYTESFAEKVGEELKVLKGTITIISENYAKFTDLATGGSTTISGDNVTTGIIKSNGYVSGSKGMAIDLDRGIIDSVNMKLDENGNLDIGGYISTDKGMLTNLIVQSDGRFENHNWIGFGLFYGDIPTINKADISLDFSLPANFTLISAYLTFYHTPALWNVTGVDTWGSAKNLKLYKVNNSNKNFQFNMTYGGDYQVIMNDADLTEIPNAFNSSTYTPSNTSGNTVEEKTTIDIKSYLSAGKNKLIIRSTEAIPSLGEDFSGINTAASKTGMGRAVLNIIGYMPN